MKILIAPLDWGLGHATRMIPLIRQKVAENHEVVIACPENLRHLMEFHFPELRIISDIPPYSPFYFRNIPVWLSMMLQWRKFSNTIHKERKWLLQLLQQERFDHIISDHRYGLQIDGTRCSIVSHQLSVQAPFFLSHWINCKQAAFFNRFSECLVPDNKERELSGKLSESGHIKIPIQFIGPLSRFTKAAALCTKTEYEWCAIVSGPDPMRQKFIEKLVALFRIMPQKNLIICGDPSSTIRYTVDNVDIVSHLNDNELQSSVRLSKFIICRSGYSTLMDLQVWKRRALLVPTPGQTEQEYLANRQTQMGHHIYCSEKKLTSELLAAVKMEF